MVWPVRLCHCLNVSSNNGAEPEMNKRMCDVACGVSEGSASMRTYKVGTPIITVARAIHVTARLGSNLLIHNMGLPLMRAP